MASRAQQKEQARQRRLEAEQQAAAAAARLRRNQMVIGVILLALVVAGVAVAISSGGAGSSSAPKVGSPAANAAKAKVASLLSGIPQAGNRIGDPTAKVTVTEYGDLECPFCAEFAKGAESQLIANEVRAGKVQVVYRSLCTATCNGPNQNLFGVQQAAAIAAGLQGYEWNYIELFYNEQGDETTPYVTDSYLNGLAGQIPGLNYNKWLSDRSSSSLVNQVNTDRQQAAALGFSSTPTIVVQGPKGETIDKALDYASLQAAIKQVS
jgi:protein-disulfide isomerase